MQTLHSDYFPLTPVDLPFKGRQLRMGEFDLADPVMPEGFEDYQRPVTELIEAAGASWGTAWLTVDEKMVEPGWSQRRPRPHVDGVFLADSRSAKKPKPKTKNNPPNTSHGPGGWLHGPSAWRHGGNLPRMHIIIASSAVGCRAWKGVFHGDPALDGDLGHIADQLGEGEVLPAFMGYLLTPDCVHESMIMTQPTQRTFMRIALPLDYNRPATIAG